MSTSEHALPLCTLYNEVLVRTVDGVLLKRRNRSCPLSLWLLFVLIISGCTNAPLTTKYRELGREHHEKWFKELPETASLHEVINIDKLTIHIVSDRKDFDWEKARNRKHGIAAYANTRNEISILGKKIGGKIIVNQLILGHEFNHILNFADRDVVDPDDKAAMDPSAGK